MSKTDIQSNKVNTTELHFRQMTEVIHQTDNIFEIHNQMISIILELIAKYQCKLRCISIKYLD